MILIKEIEFYKIFSTDDGYLVQNSKMEGFCHSHIKNLNSAEWICNLSIKKKVPHDIPVYFIESLIRINDDKDYICKLKDLQKSKCKEKQCYLNSNKGIRKK